MATFTIETGEGICFNVKAIDSEQAYDKALCFLEEYPQLRAVVTLKIYDKDSIGLCKTPFNYYHPVITMASTGHNRSYKVNPNTNKKSIARLLSLV